MVRAGLFERAGTGGFSLLRILIVLAAVAALVRIVSLAVSDQVAVGRPELALSLDGGNWKALMVRAEKALKDEKSEDAVLDARSALRADPLAAGALRVLGVVEEKHGKDGVSDKSERLMRAAADVSRRDAMPQVWLLGRHLQSGDLAQAMSRLDLIMRTQNSTLAAKLVSLLLPLLSNDDATRELAKLLERVRPGDRAFSSKCLRRGKTCALCRRCTQPWASHRRLQVRTS